MDTNTNIHVMGTIQEVLLKYEKTWRIFQKGGTITLSWNEKEELAKARKEIYGVNTNISCDICVEEMLRQLYK